MVNKVDTIGLTVDSLAESITSLTEDFREIYGADINVASNTPDGQLINLIAQIKTDLLTLLTGIYNSFDPDQAVGILLDQRCAINGVQRQGATFSFINIQITTDRALTLQG